MANEIGLVNALALGAGVSVGLGEQARRKREKELGARTVDFVILRDLLSPGKVCIGGDQAVTNPATLDDNTPGLAGHCFDYLAWTSSRRSRAGLMIRRGPPDRGPSVY